MNFVDVEADKIKDLAGEKIKDYFITFLEKFTEETNINLNSNSNSNNINDQFLSSSILSDPRLTQNTDKSNVLSISSSMSSDPRQLDSNAYLYPPPSNVPYYKKQLIGMKNDGYNTLFIDFSHVFQFNDVLATAIAENYYRFEPFLKKALFVFVQNYIPDYVWISNTRQKRIFWTAFYGLSVIHKLRELTTNKIGQLLAISGTVTRTSEVRPELYFGTFQCNECRAVVKNVEQQFKYTEPPICQNPVCGNRSNWTLLMEQSIFLDWQRIRVQENSSEIPPGSMPRTMDVIVRNDLVERAKAGDKCDFTGCLIVVPDISQLALPGGKLEGRPEGGRSKEGFGAGITGLKALGVRELGYKLAFMATMVSPSESRNTTINIRNDDIDNENPSGILSAEEKGEILRIKNTSNLYQKLVESIAPSIFGHQDIKAGILLMLFGGIHKVTSEGINLRGDVNICLVGDPGTAKSQFLKYVTGFFPRSVYTSGKSSSAAGLTASVVKDEETGDFTIEAGALMLADNGICAIDEFDKMDITDQVAIHEAMEQQTISISKAGIQATLNARTSILAAANPLYGRYDKKKSLRQNISMSAPIMSRFDLFFVILDDCSEASDYNIARHILSIHRFKDEAMDPEFSVDELHRYIKYARTLKPIITDESAQLLVEKYCLLRQNDVIGSSSTSYRMTVRQLESMIRLSEALSRLHIDEEVKPKYVREAYRLLKSSIIRVETENIDLWDEKEEEIPQSLNEPNATIENNMNIANSIISTKLESSQSNNISIKYELYVRISNMVVYQLRRKDFSQSITTEEGIGMKKSEVIEWYLEQIENEINSEDELNQKKKLVKAVIDRLVHKDCVLIELKETDGDDPILVVHPNYQP